MLEVVKHFTATSAKNQQFWIMLHDHRLEKAAAKDDDDVLALRQDLAEAQVRADEERKRSQELTFKLIAILISALQKTCCRLSNARQANSLWIKSGLSCTVLSKEYRVSEVCGISCSRCISMAVTL